VQCTRFEKTDQIQSNIPMANRGAHRENSSLRDLVFREGQAILLGLP
jgi:hypothetical protein